MNYDQITVSAFFSELDKIAACKPKKKKRKKKPKPPVEFLSYNRRVRHESRVRNARRRLGKPGAYNRSERY